MKDLTLTFIKEMLFNNFREKREKFKRIQKKISRKNNFYAKQKNNLINKIIRINILNSKVF